MAIDDSSGSWARQVSRAVYYSRWDFPMSYVFPVGAGKQAGIFGGEDGEDSARSSHPYIWKGWLDRASMARLAAGACGKRGPLFHARSCCRPGRNGIEEIQ